MSEKFYVTYVLNGKLHRGEGLDENTAKQWVEHSNKEYGVNTHFALNQKGFDFVEQNINNGILNIITDLKDSPKYQNVTTKLDDLFGDIGQEAKESYMQRQFGGLPTPSSSTDYNIR